MTMKQQYLKALKLSKDERIEFAQLLWESVTSDNQTDDFELTDEQKSVLKHRSELLRAGKTERHSLDEIVAHIRENS